MGFCTVRADLSVAKRVTRFFFCFYNVIQIFLAIGIMSYYQENMKNIFIILNYQNILQSTPLSQLYSPAPLSIYLYDIDYVVPIKLCICSNYISIKNRQPSLYLPTNKIFGLGHYPCLSTDTTHKMIISVYPELIAIYLLPDE